MTEPSSETVLATITPSKFRRFIGVGLLSILGGLLLYIGLAHPPESIALQLVLLLLGAGTLFLAERLRRASAFRLELTPTGLRDSAGRRIAEVENVVRVDRGTFALKPSNGFVVLLAKPDKDGDGWAPGLWWRLGRRVGVGGLTSAGESAALAEILKALKSGRMSGV